MDAQLLADNNDLHTPAGHIAVGWLVVEDLFTVLALVLLPAFFSNSETPLWQTTSAGMANSTEVIRQARDLNPDIRVMARAGYLRDVSTLHEAGADTIYSAEGEVALAFIEDIMERLGATAEQIDRERARAHEELFGRPGRGRRLQFK